MDKEFLKIIRHIKKYEHVLKLLPVEITRGASDIRLKAGQSVTLCAGGDIYFVKRTGTVTKNPGADTLVCSKEDISEIFMSLCAYSVFSHENEIKNGYITVSGGYRVGICGTAVHENGHVMNIRDVNTLVFRIPRVCGGGARVLFERKVDFSAGILVAGEPSSGKTTFLRDLASSLSRGDYAKPKRVAVIDERCEIGAGFDLGPCADILSAYPKKEGITMAVRSLAPEIIICDEISPDDCASVMKAAFSGVPVTASVHAGEETILKSQWTRELLLSGAFSTVVFLEGRTLPGRVKNICMAGDLIENGRRFDSGYMRSDAGTDEIGGPAKKGGHAA